MDPRINVGNEERRTQYARTDMRQKCQALTNTPRPTLWRRLSDGDRWVLENVAVACGTERTWPVRTALQLQLKPKHSPGDRTAGSVDRPADVAPGYCTVCKLSVVTQGFAVRWQRYLHRRAQVSGGLPRHTALKRNFAYKRRMDKLSKFNNISI